MSNWGYRYQTIDEFATIAGFAFGGAPFAGDISQIGIVPSPIIDTNIPNWTKINNTEVPNWGVRSQVINEFATIAGMTFGGAPFAGNILFTGTVQNPIIDTNTPNWTKINTTQTTNWTLVNDFQG